MKILGSCFSSGQSLCSFIESSCRDACSSLRGRVSSSSGRLFIWVRERLEWVKNFFLNLFWPREKTASESKKFSEADLLNSDVFRAFCEKPYELYDQIGAAKKNRNFDLVQESLFFLSICPCKKMPPALRLALEGAVVEKMQEIYPNKKEPIVVVSLGMGGLYQEAVYLAKLVNAGYENVIFIGIDPELSMRGVLAGFCKNVLKGKVKIGESQYFSLEAYQKKAKADPSLKPDLLLCIDLSDEKYNVDGKSLPEHAFSCLQQSMTLKKTTLIAHSFLKKSLSAEECSIIPTAICVQNSLGEENLHALQKGKKEDASPLASFRTESQHTH